MGKLNDIINQNEDFTGAIFVGALNKGKFKSKIRKINDINANIDNMTPYDIYVVVAPDGVNARVAIPEKKGYSKENYSKIPIKFHLKKGEMLVLLSKPVRLSANDYWCYIGNKHHFVFNFYGSDKNLIEEYFQMLDTGKTSIGFDQFFDIF